MRVIIDRFEGDFAVAEAGEKMLPIPRELLIGAQEGDTVEITVLGKLALPDEEPPHAIFERLRRKSRRKKRTAEKAPDEAQSPAEAVCDSDAVPSENASDTE